MTTIALGQIRPNPFRAIDRYPIDRDKIEALKGSIDRTGFWDNIVARHTDTEIQIAYGHHRLVALKELYPPSHKIDLILRSLDDASMLHIMADENMQEWSASAGVVVETVRAVRDFLATTTPARVDRGVKSNAAVEIAEFLGWPEGRVMNAVRILNAEDDEILEPDDTKDLALEQAVVMRAQVGRITDPVVRREAITRVRAGLTSGDIGKRGIADTVHEVRQQTGYDRPRQPNVVPPASVAEHLWREIDDYFRTTVNVNGRPVVRAELVRLIAENRNAQELTRSIRPWADQLADALDDMATEASRLAELLRAEQAVAIGA